MDMQYWTKKEWKKEKIIWELYIQIVKADQFLFWGGGYRPFHLYDKENGECMQGVCEYGTVCVLISECICSLLLSPFHVAQTHTLLQLKLSVVHSLQEVLSLHVPFFASIMDCQLV